MGAGVLAGEAIAKRRPDELVDAVTRTGDVAAAADALEQLAKPTGPGGTDWALGIKAPSPA